MVNVALADFLVTGLLVPASAIVILAGLKDNLAVCRFQWFLAALCFLVTVISIAAIAVENYTRLCCTNCTYEVLTPCRITTLLLVIWFTCASISGVQLATDLSFDYCTRKYSGLIPYQATIAVVFVVLPVTLAFCCYARTIYHISAAKSRPNFKPPITFSWDYSLMQTNMYSFLLFIVFWLPFGIVLAVGTAKRIPDRLFYNFAWFAISKSCVNSILYCCLNRHFRDAYVNLFHYCCCKTTVSFGRRQRPEGVRPSGDVRVHIIPGYNIYSSPMRGSREGQANRTSHRPNGRDVYEL